MANPRTKVVYITDNGLHIVIKVPAKYVTAGGFTAPAQGTTYDTRPSGLRLRHANCYGHVPDSSNGAGDAHFIERKIPCNASALVAGQPLALTTQLTHVDGPSDTITYVVNGWTGERRKNID